MNEQEQFNALIKSRQQNLGLSDEKFAALFGLTHTSIARYKSGGNLNMDAREKMIDYYITLRDYEMVGALLAYRTGRILSPIRCVELGRAFVDGQEVKKKQND